MEVNKNELNDISQKAIDVKNKIENEIKNINKLYEETIDKLTKSFIIKHEKLVKEENDLKEQLKTKVSKKKKELENYLSIFNYEIKNSERIKKGIIEMEKEKEEKNKKRNYRNGERKRRKKYVKSFILYFKYQQIYDKNERIIFQAKTKFKI